MLHVAVCGSGRGSNFQAILSAMEKKSITGVDVRLVISNNSTAGILDIARAHHIPAVHLSQKQFPTETMFVDAFLELLRAHEVAVVVLAGYMKRLPPTVVKAYRRRIINIHPALLPKFGGAGMYGAHVHEAVIAAGEKESGATVHFVDEEYDHGEIILQRRVPVREDDTPASLAERVLNVEHEILPAALHHLAMTLSTGGNL